MPGAAGTTVYGTGRSMRKRPATPGRPETIEERAEMVTEQRSGGHVAGSGDGAAACAIWITPAPGESDFLPL